MATPPKERKLAEAQCQHCGHTFLDIVGRLGRPRRWCNVGCKNHAYRARKALGLTRPPKMTSTGSPSPATESSEGDEHGSD